MKLATLQIDNPSSQSERLDGRLVLVHPDCKSAVYVEGFPTLLSALENWPGAEAVLRRLERELVSGQEQNCLNLSASRFKSPLPRSWAFLDGSAYLEHVRRVRKSRGAEPPPDLETNPLMYQGLSDGFLDPCQPIPVCDEAHGVDFESEIAVITDFVPMGTPAEKAAGHIKLVLLLNDVSLRNIIPGELAKGFGFLQGKPSSSFAPLALTPDELGPAWKDGKASVWIESRVNGKLLGRLNSDEMHFSFPELIAHAARTRNLSAGTIVGSGTVSNSDESRGVGCLVESRVLEIIRSGSALTPYLKIGDEVSIEAFGEGKSLFGAIKQRCNSYNRPA